MAKHLILDFNDPNLEFKVEDLKMLNLSTLYKNIDKFNDFAYQLTACEIFDTIYNTTLFQVTLANPDNSVDDVLYVYNMIANDALIDNKKYPTILKKTFVRLMKTKGYSIRRCKKCVAPYVYENKGYFVKSNNGTREYISNKNN